MFGRITKAGSLKECLLHKLQTGKITAAYRCPITVYAEPGHPLPYLDQVRVLESDNGGVGCWTGPKNLHLT